jgi:ADP-ribose pyrophosphatase
LVEDEQIVFDGSPFVQVRRQRVRTDTGKVVDDYYQVDLPDFAICCPITSDGRVITLWQYKHGARAWGLTFPAGLIADGEDPEAAMRRELLEETGHEAGAAHFLGRYVCSGNQGAGWANLFILNDCVETSAPDSGDLEKMEIRLLSPAEVDKCLEEGAISGLPHLAIWTAARYSHPNLF